VSERWMADTRAQMDELRELCDAENWSKVVDIAHAVKGAAAQIGAVRVSLAADKAYLAARDDPPCSFSIVDMVMLLRRAFDSTVMELKRGG
jgi:HPt (histidine-containing phosphotransfer) domain-containing protein